MTVDLLDLIDTLRWVWLAVALGWIGWAWLHRVEYRRVLFGLVGLVVLDWVLHAFGNYAESPDSDIPTDFALYTVMMVTAALAGLGAACLYARWRGMKVATVIDAALVCAVVGGIGGRAEQVLTNWAYYAENRNAIMDLAQGGFGWHGAFVVGVIALILFAIVSRNSFWRLADAGAVGLALASSIGWYGALLTHENYGVTLDAGPTVGASAGLFGGVEQFVRGIGYNFVQDLPDAYNIIELRVPVQVMAILFFGVLFIGLIVWTARSNGNSRAGEVFVVYLIVTFAASFVLGFWRGDVTLLGNGLRVDQWIDLALVVSGLVLAVLQRGRVGQTWRGRNRRHNPSHQPA